MRFTDSSVIINCRDLTAGRSHIVEIGPMPSSIFFSSLLYEGLRLMEGVELKPPADPIRKDLGHVICAVALFKDHGLIKCTAPATGESRSLEVYPCEFAEFLGKALESRPNTKVEYEYFK
jgi:hypothetical protein